MPFPKLPVFHHVARFVALILLAGTFQSCVPRLIDLRNPRMEKSAVERSLQTVDTLEKAVELLSFPDVVVNIYDAGGLKETRLFYRGLMLSEKKTSPEKAYDLTLAFDAEKRMANYAWGDFTESPSMPAENFRSLTRRFL